MGRAHWAFFQLLHYRRRATSPTLTIPPPLSVSATSVAVVSEICEEMGSKLFDGSLKLLIPSSSDNIKEISFRTIPSVTKLEIKNFMEGMYGIGVEKVRTLNMEGKKKRRGNRLVSRPNYKKAYVTLKKPVSSLSDLPWFQAIGEEIRHRNQEILLDHFKKMSLR
ncbi:PREDICTED: uncharacterized protein LOC104818439 [Tarenaya hassleriana]|uniref:uncharacterized protein LOC104818439 n=1 Tax=Tarenaya hassleriana TaxID=28532 RepID=UPI00053C942E|nr:PREDICTED: uncharacterized protein LOC104818439 [Tarenaya hassleriana]